MKKNISVFRGYRKINRFRYRTSIEVNTNIYEILAQKPVKSMTKEELEIVEGIENSQGGASALLSDLQFIEEHQEEFASYKVFEVPSATPGLNDTKVMKVGPVVGVLAVIAALLVAYFAIFGASEANPIDYQIAFLPDGSQIQYAPDASYSYDNDTYLESREVTLTGNAFFDVVHNDASPFIVYFKEAKLSVLGTSFYIFQDEEVVSVRDGKVKVEKGAESVVLYENEAVSYAGKSITEVNYKGRKASLFSREYKNASLNQVLQELSEEIGLDLMLHADIQSCVYNGVFENATALEVLEEMSLLYNMEYRVLLTTLHVDTATCE